MLRNAVTIGVLLAILTPALANAQSGIINAEPMHDKKLRIDGLLREWPGNFAKFNKRLKGSLTASGLVGYDDKYLYVAVKADDERIARTRAAGNHEDHATLRLAFPNKNGGYRSHTLKLYPGEPGKLPGVVKIDGGVTKQAKLVEAPVEGGIVIEAQIPWSLLPSARLARVGLKGTLSYSDASKPGAIKNIVATSTAKGSQMPYLPLEGEQALRGALLQPQGLSDRPLKEAFGNVVGDAQYERVAVYGQFLSVVGPGYRDGKEFYFGELNITGKKQLTRLQLDDLDGDGRSEVLVQKRLGGDEKYREVLLAFKMHPKDAPSVVFAHEVGIVTDVGEISNKVKIRNGTIVIEQGKAEGFDPGSYDEPLPGEGVPSALLPWDTVKSRTFQWSGSRMEAADETSWKPKQSRGTKSRKRSDSSSAGPPPPPIPRPPTAAEMLDRVYALYRKDRGVGGKKPRFDFVTDVVGDAQTERVLVHDKDIVVFGEGFKEGHSYTFINVGVKDPKDILHATARDLTGDGKAEIILRGVLKAKASKELGGDIVERYALFIYKVLGDKLVRVFGAETGRALGGQRILGGVVFTPDTHGVAIELGPARALGWSEKDYPFPEDTLPAGGLEPLALPWGSLGTRRYEFKGSEFTQ